MKDVKLGENTLIPFSIIGIFLSVTAAGAWWASAMYVRVAQAETKIGSLEMNHQEVVKELRLTNETLIEIKAVLKQRAQ